jgi:N-acetylglucosamine malate deacetylase 1
MPRIAASQGGGAPPKTRDSPAMTSVPLPFPLPKTVAAPPRGKVAIIAPHPDDEVVGCGGSLVFHREAGDPVRVLVVTDGRAGNVGKRLDAAEYAELRRRECAEAARVLGGYSHTFWDYPDSCEVTEEALNEVAGRIADWLRADLPDVVYAPWPGECNTDHAAISESTRRALKSVGFRGVCLGYEVYNPAPIDVLLDISRVAEKKRAAIRCFASQLADTPIDHIIFGIHASRSLLLPKGARYGEGFFTIR